MLNKETIKALLDEICYELDVKHYIFSHTDMANIHQLKIWCKDIKENYSGIMQSNKEALVATEELDRLIREHDEKPVPVLPKSVIKNTYQNLVHGVFLPNVVEVHNGNYMLEDYELTEEATTKHTDIKDLVKSAATRHFVEGMIEKYKPETETELWGLFKNS